MISKPETVATVDMQHITAATDNCYLATIDNNFHSGIQY